MVPNETLLERECLPVLLSSSYSYYSTYIAENGPIFMFLPSPNDLVVG